jgi:hypothetical protein
MEIQVQEMPSKPRREPCNKGKLIGQQPPLRPKHVWSIRTRLQMEGRTRDLAMFNLAIDSKLRGCDVVALRTRTLHRASMRSIAPQCGRRRPVGPSGLSDGADAAGRRRLHQSRWQETRRISLQWPW